METAETPLSRALAVLLIFLAGASAAFLYVKAFLLSPVWPDSGYTLPMAERIAEGAMPFRDYGAQHTTSVMFLYALVDRMAGTPVSYETYLGIDYAVSLLVVVLLFGVLSELPLTALQRSMLGAQFILAFYAAEGWTINLEPFVLLFGLSATVLYLRSDDRAASLFLSGILAGIAVTMKQYALFLLGAELLTVFLTAPGIRIKAARCTAVAAGAAAPIAAYYSILAWYAPGGFTEVFASASGRWYKPEPEKFSVYLSQLLFFAPYLLTLPVLLRGNRSLGEGERRLAIFASFALLLSLAQGFVRQYPHYLLHSIPFASVLGGFLLLRVGRVAGVLLMAVSCLSAGTCAYRQYEQFISWNMRGHQRALGRQLLRTIPPKSVVMFMGPPGMVYVCDFLPPDPHVPGYNFLHNYSAEEMGEMMSKSEFVVTWPNDYMYFGVLADRFGPGGAQFFQELERRGFERRNGVKDRNNVVIAEIFQRRKAVPAGLPASPPETP